MTVTDPQTAATATTVTTTVVNAHSHIRGGRGTGVHGGGPKGAAIS